MARTTAYMSKVRPGAMARPYSVQSAQRNEPLYLEKADETMHAAGGMVSTAPDLAKFLIAQRAQGKLDGAQVLPARVVAESQAQQAATDGTGFLDFKRDGYAWGWYVGEYKGKRMLHHFGGFAGFHAHLSFIPEANVGLVVLNNEDFLSARVTSLVADHAYGILLGEPGVDEKVSLRFDELIEKASQLEAMVAKQREAIQARSWELSLPLEAYVGTYSHPLLGDVTVSLNGNGELALDWGRLSALATPYEGKDNARVEFVPNSGQVVSFRVSEEKVHALEMDDMTFGRDRPADVPAI